MGHLINPIAYRLGHSRSWEDSWFVRNIYYPEFLHSILKIRCYIYFFWTSREMEKKGILFSHFYIYKFLKNLLVKIFLYNTDLEKNTYAFYARGVGIFSDSFYYRFKKKKKKKEPDCYDRYKPDLFFPFFLYYVYCSRKKVKRKIIKKKSFKFNTFKRKNQIFFPFLKNYNDKKRAAANDSYFGFLKNSDLDFFFKKLNITNENKMFLNIFKYERKIKRLNLKKVNFGFLDFFIYLFFKINMLERKKDDNLRLSKKKRNVEMIFNYITKIKKLIVLVRKFLELKLRLGTKKTRKRSIKNFIFFLVFILNIYFKVRNVRGRKKFKLGELNIQLTRLFIFNKILTNFAIFYGNFLSHIVSLLTQYIKKSFFKFCFITHNTINAKFIARYIGLKLRKKFPLFYVINPLKREFRKLANKKKKKKFDLLYNYFNYGIDIESEKYNMSFKAGFRYWLIALFNKYLKKYSNFYSNSKTLMTSDLYIYFLILKNKYKDHLSLKFYKQKFRKYFKISIWNINLNKNWIQFLFRFMGKKSNRFFLKKKVMILKFMKYIENKLFINLFFSFNKNNIDTITYVYSKYKWIKESFNHFNSDFTALIFHNFFYNYNLLGRFITSNLDIINISISTYFYRSFMFYLHSSYSFVNFDNYCRINKKKRFLKLRGLYQPSSYILGYKMSCKGRFTRKQRASSVWFHQGFVPLNTFKGFVDYSFFTIPLKNSAISIKLWLYKNKNEILWYSKHLSERIY